MIKATFPAGTTAITVNGLHQWDYGQKLEISCNALPALVEVHFGTMVSKEAIVRSAAGINGVVTATIPDELLEQTRSILAWVYVVNSNSGTTILTVTMPVVPRPRPAAAATIPEEIGDKYTAGVDAINAQIAALQMGNVTVASALYAREANRATSATYDDKNNKITETYQPKNRGGFQPIMYFSPVSGRLYMFKVLISGSTYYATILWSTNDTGSVSLGYGFVDGKAFHFMLNKVAGVNTLSVTALHASDGSPAGWLTDPTIYFCQI